MHGQRGVDVRACLITSILVRCTDVVVVMFIHSIWVIVTYDFSGVMVGQVWHDTVSNVGVVDRTNYPKTYKQHDVYQRNSNMILSSIYHS